MNDALNFTRGLLGQGVGLGWGDEAEAFLRSKVQGVPYEKSLADVQQEYGQYTRQHPILAPATEFVGGVLPAVASYLATAGSEGAAAPAAAATTAREAGALAKLAANPAVRGALTGTAFGAIGGAGTAQPGKRLEGADIGGKLGMAMGAVMPAVVHGGASAYNWLSNRLMPTEEKIARTAASKINRALSEARGGVGMTPSEAEQIVAGDVARGIPSTLANVDPALVDIAETVAQRSGKSARRVEQTIGEQARGSRQRVYERARRALGGRDYFEDENKMVQDLRANAKDVYSKAYEFGAVKDPTINQILDNPKFKAFYDKARDIADSEALAAKLRGEDPSKYHLEPIYEATGRHGENGVPIYRLRTNPDVRTLDYVKRGIDATIERGFEGKGMSTADASALRDLRREFVKAIDRATTDETGVSAYQQARQKYAGDMEVIDALRTGRAEFSKMSHQEISRLLSGMSDSEKNAFKTGVLQNVYDTVMNTHQNINAAQRLIGSPEMTAKLQPLFDSTQKFDMFKSALQREAQLMQQSQRVLGGAATGRRVQARERFEDEGGVGEMVGSLLNKGFHGSLTDYVLRAARNSSMTDEMADKVAQMLMSRKPADVAASVKILEKYGAAAQQAAHKMAATETGATLGATKTLLPTTAAESTKEERSEIPDVNADLGTPNAGETSDEIPDIEKDLTTP